MTEACMMPLHASFKIGKIAARIGTFASVENRTGNCHMFKILCLTSNFNLPNSTGMPREWGKVKKKTCGNSLPRFLMTSASGTLAADIISHSKADGKFHLVMYSHHIFFQNCDLLWPLHMTNQQYTEDQIQALVRDFHMKDHRGDVWRQSVVPAKYFPWPLHVVKAISQ